MRCRDVGPLADAFAEGRLPKDLAREIEHHAATCARCASLVLDARAVRAALSSAPHARAPRGFTDRVMTAVYRQALVGAAERREEAAKVRAAATYRRLGISFVVTAGILAISLLVPRAAYTGLLTGRGGEIGTGSNVMVRQVMTGAADAVQEVLGESGKEGVTR